MINLSNATYHTFGGHFQSAVVSGTCESIIDALDGECERFFNEDVGLNVIR
jgi:predicted DNA-binding protein with PD1-like motif